MQSLMLPLPLFLLVPRGFGQTCYLGRCVIPCMDRDGNVVAQILCEPADERKLLGIIPMHDSVSVSVYACDASGATQASLATGSFRDSIGVLDRRALPALELLDASGEPYAAITDWCGVDAILKSEDGTSLGSIGMRHILSSAFELRAPGGSRICVVRTLDRQRCGRLRFSRARGQTVIAFEDGADGVDARLLVAWLYALAMRTATS